MEGREKREGNGGRQEVGGDVRSSYLNLPGMQTMLNSLAATRASSPKKRNL